MYLVKPHNRQIWCCYAHQISHSKSTLLTNRWWPHGITHYFNNSCQLKTVNKYCLQTKSQSSFKSDNGLLDSLSTGKSKTWDSQNKYGITVVTTVNISLSKITHYKKYLDIHWKPHQISTNLQDAFWIITKLNTFPPKMYSVSQQWKNFWK